MIPTPEAFRGALVECPDQLGPAWVLERYGKAARNLQAHVEIAGRSRAKRDYSELLAEAAPLNPYSAAWLDAFGGTTR